MLFTAYIWILLVLTLAPLWLLLALLPAGPTAAAALALWARTILRSGGCRVEVRGLEYLQHVKPAVVVVNHASYLDAIAIMAALPRPFRFVVNHEAARWPLVGLAIRKAGHLVVNRGRLADRHACALAMIETLRSGISVVVFPEGTFDRDGRLLPFRPGAFRVAAEARRPVVPVTLCGTRQVFGPAFGRLRRGPIAVTIGMPLPAESAERHAVARVRDRAREEIASRLAEANASRKRTVAARET